MLILTLALSTIQLSMTATVSSGETNVNPTTTKSLRETHSLSCTELDDQLARLGPQTYSDKPGFYSDPLEGAAIWAGVMWTPAWAYVGYSEIMEEYRQNQIADVHTEVEQLRRLKAQRHCYE